jgi:TolA-binding protein
MSGASPEDLSTRSRRGATGAEEERELSRALDASATLRVAHRVGLDFDRATAVRAGDEDLILAAADRALAGLVPGANSRVVLRAPSRKHPRKIAAALVAAAMISASGMAAAWWTGIAKVPWLPPAPETARTETAAPSARKVHARANVPRPEPAPVALPEPEPAPVETAAPEAPAAQIAAEPVRRPGRAVAELGAAELFRGANAARRAGDFTGARRLYSRLIAKYPGSDEAQLSEVSLGKLLLASGEAVEAEREFRHYLSGARAPLAEEALVSQAESFHAMNRGGDERKAWARLLATHPNSVYAARARTRLAAIDHEAAASGP